MLVFQKPLLVQLFSYKIFDQGYVLVFCFSFDYFLKEEFIGMTKYRKERSFRERKISHERKVLFQLFGSNYLFLLIQNTIFDMIIIYSMLLYVENDNGSCLAPVVI